jgi:hypothetical protein
LIGGGRATRLQPVKDQASSPRKRAHRPVPEKPLRSGSGGRAHSEAGVLVRAVGRASSPSRAYATASSKDIARPSSHASAHARSPVARGLRPPRADGARGPPGRKVESPLSPATPPRPRATVRRDLTRPLGRPPPRAPASSRRRSSCLIPNPVVYF